MIRPDPRGSTYLQVLQAGVRHRAAASAAPMVAGLRMAALGFAAYPAVTPGSAYAFQRRRRNRPRRRTRLSYSARDSAPVGAVAVDHFSSMRPNRQTARAAAQVSTKSPTMAQPT